MIIFMHRMKENKRVPEISWKNQYSVCVVLASKGYPSSYPTGDEITGFENFPLSFVFHPGTKKQDEK
ncbi:MAG: hypothetical protein Ct9H300mP17_05140 [Candidatus Nitrosopelagicus sp.]|nr:MAG: hypothetical protein Ct9H300mP17_05140 [Candidatus Nitrosopelagicus sp.]